MVAKQACLPPLIDSQHACGRRPRVRDFLERDWRWNIRLWPTRCSHHRLQCLHQALATEDRPTVRLDNGRYDLRPARGRIELIPRIVCDSSGDMELPFVLRRVQFPLRPAWAMTINKSQGQTIPGRLGVYLPTPVFSHGILYVALSRATAGDRVKVLVLDHGDQQRKVASGPGGGASIYTLNLVDQSLLRDDFGVEQNERVSSAVSAANQADNEGNATGIGQEVTVGDAATRQAEQHRLSTIEFDPRLHAARDDKREDPSSNIPASSLMADEWASFESSGPPSANIDVSDGNPMILEERAEVALEYVSDVEGNELGAEPV